MNKSTFYLLTLAFSLFVASVPVMGSAIDKTLRMQACEDAQNAMLASASVQYDAESDIEATVYDARLEHKMLRVCKK